MNISTVTTYLETIAPPVLQEGYDNSGLLTGSGSWPCTGILICLDATEAVVEEAILQGCNLVVAHHPIVFGGLKRLTGSNYVERTIIAAIKNEIAIYAIHTNLDNTLAGVNGRIADLLGLINRHVLVPKTGLLKKLYTFIPVAHLEKVRAAVFAAGAGQVGNYASCSFNVTGQGTFKGQEGSKPFVGVPGELHTEAEVKTEIIFPAWQQGAVIKALLAAHPYEEVAYDIIALENTNSQTGSGLVGELTEPAAEEVFLQQLKTIFELPVIRHTPLQGKMIKKVAVCGGAGSFLTRAAIAAGADIYITADVKYHEFFDADNRLVISDIGHYESERYTINLLFEVLREKFPTFAVLKTGVNTNPVHYYL